jgi:NAD(P)-dependent dehydrogenase (short-subunit alcohol dehydrogenase family)
VLINNAGFGAYGPLEVTPMEVVRRQFDTNVIGLLAVTKTVLPVLRQQGGGVIVNVSSILPIGGRGAAIAPAPGPAHDGQIRDPASVCMATLMGALWCRSARRYSLADSSRAQSEWSTKTLAVLKSTGNPQRP